MAWQFRGHSPVYRQIVRHIRADILNGRYQPDEQIPPVRQLAMEASVNPNTMQRALSALEDEGLLVSRGTVGRFVNIGRGGTGARTPDCPSGRAGKARRGGTGGRADA